MKIVCPECGKQTDVLYPDLWRYKCNKRYYCSYKCFRKGEVKMGNVTWEMKEKAVKIALAGGDVLAYLEECGSKNPQSMWWTIKNKLKETDPEAYKKLPDLRPGANKPVVDNGIPKPEATVKVDGPIRIETPEANRVHIVEAPEKKRILDGVDMSKVTAPVNYGGYEVTAIRDPQLGEFYYDHDHNCIDWRDPVGDEISLGIAGWKDLLAKLPEIMGVLGVKA